MDGGPAPRNGLQTMRRGKETRLQLDVVILRGDGVELPAKGCEVERIGFLRAIRDTGRGSVLMCSTSVGERGRFRPVCASEARREAEPAYPWLRSCRRVPSRRAARRPSPRRRDDVRRRFSGVGNEFWPRRRGVKERPRRSGTRPVRVGPADDSGRSCSRCRRVRSRSHDVHAAFSAAVSGCLRCCRPSVVSIICGKRGRRREGRGVPLAQGLLAAVRSDTSVVQAVDESVRARSTARPEETRSRNEWGRFESAPVGSDLAVEQLERVDRARGRACQSSCLAPSTRRQSVWRERGTSSTNRQSRGSDDAALFPLALLRPFQDRADHSGASRRCLQITGIP